MVYYSIKGITTLFIFYITYCNYIIYIDFVKIFNYKIDFSILLKIINLIKSLYILLK